MNKLPETSSAGKKWTVEEDKQLIQSLNNEISIEDIAKQHKRTVGGIRARIKKTVMRVNMDVIEDICRNVICSMNPLTIKEICSLSKLKPEEIKAFLQQKKETMAPDEYTILMKDLLKIMAITGN